MHLLICQSLCMRVLSALCCKRPWPMRIKLFYNLKRRCRSRQSSEFTPALALPAYESNDFNVTDLGFELSIAQWCRTSRLCCQIKGSFESAQLRRKDELVHSICILIQVLWMKEILFWDQHPDQPASQPCGRDRALSATLFSIQVAHIVFRYLISPTFAACL